MSKQTKSLEEIRELARRNPEFRLIDRRTRPLHDLSKIIYKKRKEKNLTQEELAQLAKTTQNRISKMEKGELNPNINTIIQVAEALGCIVELNLKDAQDTETEGGYGSLEDQISG